MTRREKVHPAGDAIGRLRVFYAEVEGSDESLRAAIQAIATAVNRPQIGDHPRAHTHALGASTAHSLDEASVTQKGSAAEAESAAAVDGEDHSSEGSPVRALGSDLIRDGRPKVDRNAGLRLVPDLHLFPENGQSLKEYVAETKPKTAEEHILVFVHYMGGTLALPAVTVNHIFSCFKPLGRKCPADLRQTIRNIVTTKGWLANEEGNLSVTKTGSNHLLHDMGNAPEVEPA